VDFVVEPSREPGGERPVVADRAGVGGRKQSVADCPFQVLGYGQYPSPHPDRTLPDRHGRSARTGQPVQDALSISALGGKKFLLQHVEPLACPAMAAPLLEDANLVPELRSVQQVPDQRGEFGLAARPCQVFDRDFRAHRRHQDQPAQQPAFGCHVRLPHLRHAAAAERYHVVHPPPASPPRQRRGGSNEFGQPPGPARGQRTENPRLA
jgi:hypothetical protein